MKETTKYQPQHDEQRVHFLLRRSVRSIGSLLPMLVRRTRLRKVSPRSRANDARMNRWRNYYKEGCATVELTG